jgi:quercetin dioxygenase-like cupin family protein
MTETAAAPTETRHRGVTPYRRWQQEEAIPVYQGSYIDDLYHLQLSPWARAGQPAAFVNLAGQEEDDAYVLEIAPGGKTQPLHHLFEETVFVLEGRGATRFWSAEDSSRRQTVEWQRGSLFSPPINCYYEHFNLDGDRPARLFAVTNTPMLMNIFRSPEFIFSDVHTFHDRYDLAEDYFKGGHYGGNNLWVTNFVPDVRSFELEEHGNRVERDMSMQFRLANNQMVCHISAFDTGFYKRAHRHGPGAHVVILNGEGYSLLWFEGEEPRRVDWKDGSVISPMGGEFHQHFNTGPNEARYLALRLGELDPRRRQGLPYDEREIDGIRYEDEDPAIYDGYVAECARTGAEVKLKRPNYGS